MLNSPLSSSSGDEASADDVENVVRTGPRGALVVAGIATFIVVAIWVAFYVLVFTPRGVTP